MIISAKDRLRMLLPAGVYSYLKKAYFLVSSADYIPHQKQMIDTSIKLDSDIYFAHDLPALPIAAEAAFQTGAFLVYDSHEFYLGQAALKGRRRRFFAGIEKQYIHRVDLMITVNKDISSLFEKEYGLENVKIILNALPPDVNRGRLSIHSAFGLPVSVKIVAYIGAFLEDRNLEKLITASRNLADDIVFVFIGSGVSYKKLKSQARKLGVLDKKIFIIAESSHEKIMGYVKSADAGLIPYPDIDLNTKFCTPNKLFEYVQAGIPIIANNGLHTLKNLLDSYGVGTTINFDRPEDLAHAINRIMRSDILEKQRANTALISTELSWEKEGLKLAGYLNEMCENNRVRR